MFENDSIKSKIAISKKEKLEAKIAAAILKRKKEEEEEKKLIEELNEVVNSEILTIVKDAVANKQSLGEIDFVIKKLLSK